jgi:serine/threonine protein kinase/tetratricopeptide (TPR) repeat protein
MDHDQSVEGLVKRWQSLQQRGESVTVDQLCADCPEVVPEVEERIRAVASMMAFLDLDPNLGDRAAKLTMSFRPKGDAEPEEPKAEHDRVLWHERYKLGAKLGEGGMGVVYRARDGRDGQDVALKLMKATLAGTARRRFEREFRSLATLRHPHCLSVFDYGELDGGPFFTMELFLGRPITSLAGRGVAEVLEPLLQLTQALDYIHHHGIVHRDVKPSNILVRTATQPDGSPSYETRLMDFGLAKYYGVKSSLSAEAGFVGTVAYCAPEQLNLDELDHRADLFCLGLVGYELLSGRYPFPEARLAGMRPLMQALLNDKPRPLGEVNPEVPGPIADAVMRYLRKQPRRRPDSASLLRAAIAEHLGLADQTAISLAALAPVRPMLSVTGFVCRAGEQEVLDDVLRHCLSPQQQAAHDAPSLILVSGEPGIGKSSVVQEAERIARGHGSQVYEGRCFDGNLSPFQPFVEILRQLVAELRLQERRESLGPADDDLTGTHVAGLPAESLTRLLAIVGEYSGELLRIAPELRKYLPGQAYQQVDFGREADYIYRALSAFFLEVATLQPICLSFEDMQWADKSSLDLLRHLAAALADARRSSSDGSTIPPRLIIVASARAGYAQLEAFLGQLREQRHVLEMRLAPLVAGETRELIALRLNCQPEELSDDLVARVHALCGGNPFFVAETVREWYEKETITRSEAGWVLSTEAADASDLPETVRDVMRLRLQGLPPKAQQVVGAAAVIGAVVDIDLLRDLLQDLSESDILDAIDVLLPRRVFRETGNAGRVEFVHDLLRELPYADLSASRRRSLHRRVGELLEGRRERGQAVSPALLADHFRNAEDRPKTFLYNSEAASAALDAYAFQNAISHLNEALAEMPDDANEAARFQLWEMLGRANRASGRIDEAITAYEQATAHARDMFARAKVQEGIGEALHRKGLIGDGIPHFDLALREVGYPRPGSFLGLVVDTWKAAAYFHVLPAWVYLTGRGHHREDRLDSAFAIYERIARAFSNKDVFCYIHATYKMAALSKRSRKPELLAAAYSKLGFNCSLYALGWLSTRYLKRASRAAQSCVRPEYLALSQAHFGMANYCAGRLEEAEVGIRKEIGGLDKVGDWYGAMSHHFLRHVYAIRGDIARELAEAEVEITIATSCGDLDMLAWGYYGKADALARSGRVEEAEPLAAHAVKSLNDREALAVSVAYGILGYVRLQASNYSGAREALERSRDSMNRTFFLVEFNGITYPLLVESLLGPHWSNPVAAPSRSVASKARREARFARFTGRCFPNYYSHALRVSGRAAQALGKTRKAAAYFERAILVGEKLGARYELARALVDASRIIPERAEDYRRRGQTILDELGAVVPEAERLITP